MKGIIRVLGAARRAGVEPEAPHWQVALEVETDGHQRYRSLVGVYQFRDVADFSAVSLATPHDLPEWVCEESLRDTVGSYFAQQVAARMKRPDGALSDALEIIARIEDDYGADALPWNYLGTTVLPSREDAIPGVRVSVGSSRNPVRGQD